MFLFRRVYSTGVAGPFAPVDSEAHSWLLENEPADALGNQWNPARWFEKLWQSFSAPHSSLSATIPRLSECIFTPGFYGRQHFILGSVDPFKFAIDLQCLTSTSDSQ